MSKQKAELPSTAAGRRQLIKLAALLEKDAKNPKGLKFDLGSWGESRHLKKFVKADCGTTGCAVGLACVSGAFKRAGLDFEINDDGKIFPNMRVVGEFSWESTTLHGYEAIQRIFVIGDRATHWLFNADEYPGRLTRGAAGERAVAKRIRDFVTGKQQPPAER